MFDTTLFSVNLPPKQVVVKNKSLTMSGCRVILSDDNNVYSEIDELNFCLLNSNDYGAGMISIEVSFENIFPDPYFHFFVQCITLRTDNNALLKINSTQKLRTKELPNYSKVNKDGKMTVGISYFFHDLKERETIMNCNLFCVECFIALKKKTNVYGIMCKIEKTENEWNMIDGNTYQIYKHRNIQSLFH